MSGPISGKAERFFADTNLLLYALDRTAPAKRKQAATWLDWLWTTGAGRLSWQVLHEFYWNAVRKMGVPVADARAAVQAFALWQPLEATLGLVQRAWAFSDRAGLAYWDALIVAAAERSGASYLLSEDLPAGQSFGSVMVLDPFRCDPSEYVAHPGSKRG